MEYVVIAFGCAMWKLKFYSISADVARTFKFVFALCMVCRQNRIIISIFKSLNIYYVGVYPSLEIRTAATCRCSRQVSSSFHFHGPPSILFLGMSQLDILPRKWKMSGISDPSLEPNSTRAGFQPVRWNRADQLTARCLFFSNRAQRKSTSLHMRCQERAWRG